MIAENLSISNFSKQIDNKQVLLYSLKNRNGVLCQITNFGARIVSLLVPNKDNQLVDVVLGLNSIDEYQKDDKYLGATVGRFANRIAKGVFNIDGKTYSLVPNNGPNLLHGGQKGYDKVVWDAKPVISENGEEAIELTYFSKDGEEGFPGNVQVKVTYTLTNSNEIVISYWAKTDAKTILNLTNHTYFNLKGVGEGTIESHDLLINADFFTPTDDDSIPTSEIRSVLNTPMDFKKSYSIGARINEDYIPLKQANGYDHNWILNKENEKISWAATASDSLSGIELKVFTTEPGIQFYTGNFLDGSGISKGSKPNDFRSGFCIEAQHFPNSPNQNSFPSTFLDVGESYSQTTIFQFGLKTS